MNSIAQTRAGLLPAAMLRRTAATAGRAGTTLVEFAIVFPVFMLFVFALIEYGHALMVSNMVNSIAKEAAHHGSFEGTSSADVLNLTRMRLDAILPDGVGSISIKDASAFESSQINAGSVTPQSLPDIELSAAESRQLFMVHVEVDYQDVALIAPFWIRTVTLRGDSIMRRE